MKFPNFTVQFDDCSIEESKSMFIRPIEKVRLYALKPTTKPPNHIVILHRTYILLQIQPLPPSPPKTQSLPSLFPIVPNTIRSRATSFFLVFFVQKKKKKKKTRKKKSQTKKKFRPKSPTTKHFDNSTNSSATTPLNNPYRTVLLESDTHTIPKRLIYSYQIEEFPPSSPCHTVTKEV